MDELDWRLSVSGSASQHAHFSARMRERARQIGGKLDIWSRAGTGTEIELSIAGSIAYITSTVDPLFRRFRKKTG